MIRTLGLILFRPAYTNVLLGKVKSLQHDITSVKPVLQTMSSTVMVQPTSALRTHAGSSMVFLLFRPVLFRPLSLPFLSAPGGR
eukprot:354325-Chlamydomonas_euryale.AAC.1